MVQVSRPLNKQESMGFFLWKIEKCQISRNAVAKVFQKFATKIKKDYFCHDRKVISTIPIPNVSEEESLTHRKFVLRARHVTMYSREIQ